MNWTRANDAAEHAGGRLDRQRLGEPGHALDEQVALREQADEHALEHLVLSGDHAPDLEERLLEPFADLGRIPRGSPRRLALSRLCRLPKFWVSAPVSQLRSVAAVRPLPGRRCARRLDRRRRASRDVCVVARLRGAARAAGVFPAVSGAAGGGRWTSCSSTSYLNFAYTDFSTRERWDPWLDGRVYADADGLHLAFHRARAGGGLRRRVARGGDREQLRRDPAGGPGVQLLDERAAILRDVGARARRAGEGRWQSVANVHVAVGPKSTIEEYLASLTRDFPRFDEAWPFWKLAQLSAWIRAHCEIEGAGRRHGPRPADRIADKMVPAG